MTKNIDLDTLNNFKKFASQERVRTNNNQVEVKDFVSGNWIPLGQGTKVNTKETEYKRQNSKTTIEEKLKYAICCLYFTSTIDADLIPPQPANLTLPVDFTFYEEGNDIDTEFIVSKPDFEYNLDLRIGVGKVESIFKELCDRHNSTVINTFNNCISICRKLGLEYTVVDDPSPRVPLSDYTRYYLNSDPCEQIDYGNGGILPDINPFGRSSILGALAFIVGWCPGKGYEAANIVGKKILVKGVEVNYCNVINSISSTVVYAGGAQFFPFGESGEAVTFIPPYYSLYNTGGSGISLVADPDCNTQVVVRVFATTIYSEFFVKTPISFNKNYHSVSGGCEVGEDGLLYVYFKREMAAKAPWTTSNSVLAKAIVVDYLEGSIVIKQAPIFYYLVYEIGNPEPIESYTIKGAHLVPKKFLDLNICTEFMIDQIDEGLHQDTSEDAAITFSARVLYSRYKGQDFRRDNWHYGVFCPKSYSNSKYYQLDNHTTDRTRTSGAIKAEQLTKTTIERWHNLPKVNFQISQIETSTNNSTATFLQTKYSSLNSLSTLETIIPFIAANTNLPEFTNIKTEAPLLFLRPSPISLLGNDSVAFGLYLNKGLDLATPLDKYLTLACRKPCLLPLRNGLNAGDFVYPWTHDGKQFLTINPLPGGIDMTNINYPELFQSDIIEIESESSQEYIDFANTNGLRNLYYLHFNAYTLA